MTNLKGVTVASKLREAQEAGEIIKKLAEGVQGQLIYTGMGKYMFRVYTDSGEFTDYDLHHSDLCVTITDSDATFYSDAFGNRLDHNPETLGIKND
jgi:hypothetical protein